MSLHLGSSKYDEHLLSKKAFPFGTLTTEQTKALSASPSPMLYLLPS